MHTAYAQHRPTSWVGIILTLALLAILLQTGSPGFTLTNDGVWTLAKHFPKATQKSIESKQKKARGDQAGKDAKDQAIPRVQGIPNLYLGLYHEYAGRDWAIVAAIYKIESDHGQSDAPGVKSGVNAHGCCAGPGQFNIRNGHPSTWESWRLRPNANVYDPRDAVPATVRMLRAFHDAPVDRRCTGTGLDERWVNAIRHYNNTCWYVRDVAAWVRTYSKAGKVEAVPKGMTFTTSHGCNPAQDWREGLWTPEVRGFMIKMAAKFSFRISCGVHGHSRYVKGTTRESAHWTGRAFDVDRVDGHPVAPDGVTTAFGRQALGFGAKQVGGPAVLCERPRCFTDGGHQRHWHVQP